MIRDKKIRKEALIWAGMLGVIIGIIVFCPMWITHQGGFVEYGDGFLQYLPFVKELKRMIASGNFAWSWNSYLGNSFLAAYSYYTVYNPFAWFIAIFPDNLMIQGMMIATLLKLAVSMITSTLFISRFCKKEYYAILGGILYTFSGFTIVNTSFYFFLDIIAVFPLLLYALELLIVEKKHNLYIFSVFLNAVINYYFFVSTVILTVFYVFFRLNLQNRSSWKRELKTLGWIFLYSSIGTCLAGIVLIPAFFSMFESGKSSETLGRSIELFFYPQKFLEHIRTLIAPIESGRYHAFFDSTAWSSTGCYLSIFGTACVLQYWLKNSGWLKRYSIFLLICYLIPILNSMFCLFSSSIYTRWLYGLTLIYSLITVKCIENYHQEGTTINGRVLKFVTMLVVSLEGVPSLIYLLEIFGISLTNRFASASSSDLFIGYPRMIATIILTVLNYIVMWHVFRHKCYSGRKLFITVMVMSSLNFFVYNLINYDYNATEFDNRFYYEKSLVEGVNNPETSFLYRVDNSTPLANYGLFKGYSSVTSYNSLQNLNSMRYAYGAGILEDLKQVSTVDRTKNRAWNDTLLSVKYYFDYMNESDIPEGFVSNEIQNNVEIFSNENYIPMGFTYDSYSLEEDVSDIANDEHSKILLSTLVISKQDEEIVKSYLAKNDRLMEMTENHLSEVATERRKQVCNYFEGTADGFRATIKLDRNNLVFFSIPNDPSWRIEVNGEVVDPITVQYGLMGVPCCAGDNTIIGSYQPRGLKIGLFCSLISFFTWIGTELILKLKRYNQFIKQ